MPDDDPRPGLITRQAAQVLGTVLITAGAAVCLIWWNDPGPAWAGFGLGAAGLLLTWRATAR